MTVPEVAEMLRVSRAQGYALVRKGIIPSFQVGGCRRVRRDDLNRWISSAVAVNKQ